MIWKDDRSLMPIPPPHEYFDSYTSDICTYNDILRSTLSTYFDGAGRSHISLMWGFSGEHLKEKPFQGNPLLRLHFCRWRESFCLLHESTIPKDIFTLCDMSTSRGSAQTAGVMTTLKGQDPLMPAVIRRWNDSNRIWPCHIYSFATPSPEAIDRLVSLGPIIEMGAGTGYWCSLVRSRGGEVVAYDKDPPSQLVNARANAYHGHTKPWTDVRKGGVEKISSHKDVSTLLLCYPPPDTDMAVTSLRCFTGSTVCYVGEWQGDTGTKTFEKMLNTDFICTEIITLPNWSDTCYSLMIWRRKMSSTLQPEMCNIIHPFRCSYCQRTGRLYRCRFTCNVYFCNDECAKKGKLIHLNELTLRHMLCLNISQCESKISSVQEISTDNNIKHQLQVRVPQRNLNLADDNDSNPNPNPNSSKSESGNKDSNVPNKQKKKKKKKKRPVEVTVGEEVSQQQIVMTSNSSITAEFNEERMKEDIEGVDIEEKHYHEKSNKRYKMCESESGSSGLEIHGQGLAQGLGVSLSTSTESDLPLIHVYNSNYFRVVTS